MLTFNKLKRNMVLTGKPSTKVFFLAFLLFAIQGANALAQHTQERVITINMSATEILPADQIIFNITLNAEADTPQEVFDVHKKRESVLAGLLKKYDIKEEDIKYEPIRMSKRYRNDRNGGDSQTTVSNQSVSVTFDDFDIYEDIQVTLIENNFDSFNGEFSSSKISEGKEQALKNAIEAARNKAELIAETSGVSLGDIQTIHFSDHEIGLPKQGNYMRAMEMSSDVSMMEFAQTISVRATVNISFAIE